jgi:hypothetical protein
VPSHYMQRETKISPEQLRNAFLPKSRSSRGCPAPTSMPLWPEGTVELRGVITDTALAASKSHCRAFPLRAVLSAGSLYS